MKKFLRLHRHKRRLQHKGFSLFECLIVIALLSSVICLSSYFIGFASKQSVHVELDRLYVAFTYLQRKAFLEQKLQTLVIHPELKSYVADQEHLLSSGVIFGIRKEVLGPPSRPQQPLKEPITWAKNTVSFYPDGTIAAGAAYLTDHNKTCLYAITCDASEASHIRRYRYQDGWKILV